MTRRVTVAPVVGPRVRPSILVVALLALTGSGFSAPRADAEPLTPLTSAELQYLDHARRVFSVSHDPVAFRSDGRLLDLGRYACANRTAGFVGTESTAVPAVLTQLAFLYLCPD